MAVPLDDPNIGKLMTITGVKWPITNIIHVTELRVLLLEPSRFHSRA